MGELGEQLRGLNLGSASSAASSSPRSLDAEMAGISPPPSHGTQEQTPYQSTVSHAGSFAHRLAAECSAIEQRAAAPCKINRSGGHTFVSTDCQSTPNPHSRILRDPYRLDGRLLLWLVMRNGHTTGVECQLRDTVESLICSFASIAKVAVRLLMYDEQRLSPTQTLEQAGLCDRAEINVELWEDEQTGGGPLSPEEQDILNRCRSDANFLRQVMVLCSATPSSPTQIRDRIKELEAEAESLKAILLN